ncbi:MAG TPA: FAD-dependent monooxygenase [Acidimicrobiia bacterium]|nr:FAD-dependent monooxygenase [Acidimicrobiia bacterium]
METPPGGGHRSGAGAGIVVVGAGPVGLTGALALRTRGLPVVVLEASPPGRPRPGSRAIYYHRQTLERWESVAAGLGHEIARRGTTWSTKQTYWRGTPVYERTYEPPDLGSLPPFTSLAQSETERLLLDACKEAGVEFSWEHEVRHVESTSEGVRLVTTAGAVVDADSVIAADGARSAVRTSLGIALSGRRSENSFVIVDVAEDPSRPLLPARIFHYEHPAVDRRNVLLVPFAGGWRADLQCRPTDDPARWSDEGGVRRWVARVLPPTYGERITWVSTYRFLQAVADRFTDEHRRVLLVGEAAHLFAPFGARGLNSGVADALAAAEAVASARPDGVDRFAGARRAAALSNRDAAAAALRHMQARGPAIRVRRALAARRARRGRRAGAWLDAAPYGPRARRDASESIY